MNHHSIETLEPRIAPATIAIVGKTATWTDYDGDIITMKWTSAVAPAFTNHDFGAGLLVDKIAFNIADHTGAGFTIAVKALGGGDGRVELGRIDATGVNLGIVAAAKAGVLEFDAGDNSAPIPAVKSLTLGGIGNSTGLFAGGGNGTSLIFGPVPAFIINGDIGAGTVDLGTNDGNVGVVRILGSLRGDLGTSPAGYLIIEGDSVNTVTIFGSVIGGGTVNNGRLEITGPTKVLAIKGSIVGGSAAGSAEVEADDTGTFKIGGSVIGGSGAAAGTVSVDSAKMLTIGGSILGGSGGGSGEVFISGGTTKAFVRGSIIGGQITNSPNSYTGTLDTSGRFSSLTVLGDLVAGSTVSGTKSWFNGAILAFGGIGTLTIGGSVIGNNQTHAVITGTSLGAAKPANGVEVVIGDVKIFGSISFGEILSGYTTSTTPGFTTAVNNGDAAIRSITVGGNWFHSTAMAGVQDVGQDGPTTNDIRAAMSSAALTASIGSIKIKGAITDSPATTGFGGIQAERIGFIMAMGRIIYKSGDGFDTLDVTGNSFAREI